MSSQAHHSSQEQPGELVRDVDVVLWEVDAKTFQFTFVSSSAERMLGHSSACWLLPGFWAEHLHPEDRGAAQEFYLPLQRQRSKYEFECRVIAADGRAVWVRSWVSVVRAGGEPRKLRGVLVDITARRSEEETLRQQAEKERQAHLWFLESLDQVNRTMFEAAELEQRTSDVLDVVRRLLRCERADLVYPCDPEAPTWQVPMSRTGPECQSIAAPQTEMAMDPSVAEAFRIARASTTPVKFGAGCEHAIPTMVAERSGARSTLALALHPKVGRPYLFALHQCSSARVWTAAEERLFQEVGQRLSDALTSLLMFRSLQESEEKLARSERIAHLGYWDFDLDRQHFHWSDETYRIMGLEPRSRVYTNAESWEFIHPDDRATVREVSAAAFRGDACYDVAYRLIRPSGEVRFVRSRGDVIRDESGRPRRIFGTVQDVTERERLEEQFRQVQKMEAVGRLAGGVAHDFNNLLTVINGYGELLFSQLAPDDPRREIVTEIQNSGERAAKLTRQLLAFSRKQMLEPRVVNLNTLLAELNKLLQRLIGEDVELAFVPDSELAQARVDPVQFEQAIINLAVNARDAMPGGGQLQIATRNAELDPEYAEGDSDVRPGHYVLVSVSDSGYGMDEVTRARIFEPFFTTKGPARGTGLGLAMVYGFVKQSGGHVEVKSAPGRGSTFSLYLPRAQQRTPSPEPVSRSPQVAGGTETILLVEDEEPVRRLSKHVLASNGYRVLEAREGREALQIAQEHVGTIHLLVTDFVMPRMSGRELAETLALSLPQLRVLFMSGYTDVAILGDRLPHPGVAFLQKPFTARALAGKVRDLLNAEPPCHVSPAASRLDSRRGTQV